MLQTKLLDGNVGVGFCPQKVNPFIPIHHAVFRQFIATSREISSNVCKMFIRLL